MASPEDETEDILRTKADPVEMRRVERVGVKTVPGAYPVQQPGGIESGNIRPPAGRNDLLLIRQLDARIKLKRLYPI